MQAHMASYSEHDESGLVVTRTPPYPYKPWPPVVVSIVEQLLRMDEDQLGEVWEALNLNWPEQFPGANYTTKP